MKVSSTASYAGRALLSANPLTRSRMQQLRRNERLTPSGIAELQNAKLYDTLQLALRNFPFYKDISPAFSIRDVKRVLQEEFPVIDKATLLKNRKQVYPHSGNARPWEPAGKTSGTTGTPLTVYRSFESIAMEQAFIRRHWAWAGYSQAATRVTLRGDMVVPVDKDRPPFWYWNHFDRQLVISSRHLKEPFVESIIREIRNLAPFALQAYPSTAFALAKLLQNRGECLRIPIVFTASEPLYQHQRALITECFGAKIMDMYGMAERVAFATDCEHGNLHLNPDYSFVEFLDDHGRPTTDEGYVVGTTFHNKLMPLVRYRLSDRSRYRSEVCSCGRSFPLIEPVQGKYEDSISGKDGSSISPSVVTFAFKGVEHIEKSQVAQVAKGVWKIRIVPMAGYSAADEAKLLRNIHRLVDRDVSVEVELKSDIPSTEAGKFRWIVNESRG